MLQVNHPAPSFTLFNADMEQVALSQLHGKIVVLYFYPKDDTPGCTVEAIEFSDLEHAFTALNAVVVGVSHDDCISHGTFRDKHGLTVQLLADEDHKACEKYGVCQMREKEGKMVKYVQRSTFIINKAGVLKHMQYGVTPKGHAAEILEIIKTLN